MAIERQNADNEIVTITKITYGGTFRGNSYWTAHAELYGDPLSIRLWPEDDEFFANAGYRDMLQIHQGKPDLKIEALVKWDQKQGHRLVEVYPASGIPAGGVLDESARDRQWNADVRLCKTPVVIGQTARIYAIIDGKPVMITWERKADGTYERYQQGQGTQRYAKKSTPAGEVPESRIRALLETVGIGAESIRSVVPSKRGAGWYAVILLRAANVSAVALREAGFTDGVVDGSVVSVKLEG